MIAGSSLQPSSSVKCPPSGITTIFEPISANFRLFSSKQPYGSLSEIIKVEDDKAVLTFAASIFPSIQDLAIDLTSSDSRFSKLNQPATKTAPPTGVLVLSRYRKIVWHPIECPTKYVFLSGVPTAFARAATHLSMAGAKVSGISGAITSKPFLSSSDLSHALQSFPEFPSHLCTMMTLFMAISNLCASVQSSKSPAR